MALLVISASAAPSAAQISCGQYDFTGLYSTAFLDGVPFAGAARAAETITSMADGACHQDRLIAALEPALGPVAGYKAAATSAGAQKQLGLSGPVLGVLLKGMLLADGATVKVDDGARMIFELDLLVRVGDRAINTATTREEVLASLDAVIPFIELGDLMVPKGAAITGPLLQAMNGGARLGVVGEAVPMAGLDAEALAAIAGTLRQGGTVVAEAPATVLLGHPLDAALWIVEAARSRGRELSPGDVLSLGSLGRFHLAAPGVVEARYTGLGSEPVGVAVTLE